jgi:hypothetical protein
MMNLLNDYIKFHEWLCKQPNEVVINISDMFFDIFEELVRQYHTTPESTFNSLQGYRHECKAFKKIRKNALHKLCNLLQIQDVDIIESFELFMYHNHQLFLFRKFTRNNLSYHFY